MNKNDDLLDIPVSEVTEGPEDVEIGSDLLPEQRKKVREVLNAFPDVLTDLPGTTNILQHDIQLTCEVPVIANTRPVPYSMVDVVNEEVDKMISLGTIEPSISPYCSPIVIVKKKDGSNRFCIDFRALNCQTVFEAEPMPDADEIYAKLATQTLFSKLDLTKGYWQVPISDGAKRLTAFQTPKGLFQFRVMPFGLVTASATFSRLMRILLHGMQNFENFIDDILLYTSTFDEHMEVLLELLTRLREPNLTAKPSKCTIAVDRVECLGHMVGHGCLSPNVDKVLVIQESTRPETKKQLRSFLGLVGFYRKFVPNFALLALPLTDLTRKGNPNKLLWSDSAENAFQALRNSLTKFSILKLPNVKEPFVLQTDASDRGNRRGVIAG